MKTICVTGIWHQGAVLAASLADLGHSVRGFCSATEAAELSAGRPLVTEPVLPSLLRRGIRSGRLTFSADLREALAGAEFVFISTDTPVDEDDTPDLRPVFDLARAIGQEGRPDLILCVTAQVPVGTTAELSRLAGCRAAYVPEFLRLGTAVETFRRADRIVIGADDPDVADRVADLYVGLKRPIIATDILSAELAKHAANAFLATSISFANELADIAGALGADPQSVGRILKLDRRIGPHAFLSPGLGYAGGTLGRELRVLQEFGRRHEKPTPLVDAVVAINDRRPGQARRQLEEALGGSTGKHVALLGLTYKAGTSTLRRSVSLEIARDLLAAGAQVSAYDPLADLEEAPLPVGLVVAASPDAAAAGCDAVIVMGTFALSAEELAGLRPVMRGSVLLDARGTVDPVAARRGGFRYVSLWSADPA